MLKIALITVQNANNYGALLQAYAMQEVLKKYGDVTIINYQNRHISRSFDLIRFKRSFHGVLGIGKDIFRLLPRYRVIKKFKQFIEQNLNLSESFTHKELLNGKLRDFDIYIAGSDQIWNPVCINEKGEIDTAYFLDFAPPEFKKISYASSKGGYEYNPEEAVIVKNLLSSFNSLAVREINTQEYLINLLGQQVDHVLDPTLLLGKKEWLDVMGVEEKNKGKEEYILLYTVPKVALIKDVTEYYSKKLGIKVISLEQGLSAGARVDMQIRDAGPKEFMELFVNAKLIITDSFHGTCFALNLEKEFVAVSPDKHANRIESLLQLVGLKSRFVKSTDQLSSININTKLDSHLDKLRAERLKSLDYLSTAISKQ